MPGVCGVCGDPKSVARCYGAEVCGSCKIFFLRAITNKEQYVCAATKNCAIKSEKWAKNCRACRLAKCISVRMDPEAVGTVRRMRNQQHSEILPVKRKEPEILPELTTVATVVPVLKNSETTSLVPYVTGDVMRHTESLASSYAIGLSFIQTLKDSMGSARSYAQALCSLEACCFANQMTELPDVVYNAENMNVPLQLALNDPRTLCHRSPMPWEDLQLNQKSIVDMFKMLYCRQTVHYLDWLSGCPELQLLNHNDKMNLIGAQLCNVQLMMMMYKTYKTNSRGLAYCNGYHWVGDRVHTGTEHEFDQYLGHLTRYGQENVVAMFRKLDIKSEEYILLKTIAFFSCPMLLSDEGMGTVRRARQKHEQILVEYVREEFPKLTEVERLQRVHDIVSINKFVNNMAIIDNGYMSRLVTLNIGGMRCELPYDIHLRQF